MCNASPSRAIFVVMSTPQKVFTVALVVDGVSYTVGVEEGVCIRPQGQPLRAASCGLVKILRRHYNVSGMQST